MSNSLLFNLELSMNEDLIGRELQLEEEALQMAIDRVQDKVKTQGADTTLEGKRKVDSFMPSLVEAIDKWMTEQKSSPTRKAAAYAALSAISSAALAFIVARQTVHAICMDRASYPNVCMAIGRSCRDFLEYEVFSNTHAETAESTEYRLKHATSGRKGLRVLRNAYAAEDFEGLKWKPADLLRIGHVLLEIFKDTTGFIQIQTEGKAGQMKKLVVPSDSAANWVSDLAFREALMAPIHYPMIVPPKPWTTPYDGGYLNQQMHKLTLVWSPRRVVNRRLEATDMPEVYLAINALQATPWRINQSVFDVFNALAETEESVAGLPSAYDKLLPEKPWPVGCKQADIDAWIDLNPEGFTAWKQKSAEIHQENNKAASKRYAVERKVAMGTKFYGEEAMYFPHGLDFRGRIYCAAGAGAINPQSDDSGKALIELAAGKAIGSSGGFWLAVHTCNVWGLDKLSLEDRKQWTEDNSLDILNYATNPLENRGWMEADKPFGFLAACFEWAGFMFHGEDHVTHLPIAMDGACSGIQHFSAMLKDVEGAASTNVIQTKDTPCDVYTDVLTVVKRIAATSDDALMGEWSTRLTRDIVKQPTMTTPYGVTQRGMVDQIKNAIIKAVDKGSIEPFSVSAREAAKVLAPIVAHAIDSVVNGARSAMDWLKHCAQICSKADIPFTWTTPNGFEVTQDYKKARSTRIDLLYNGAMHKVTIKEDTPKLDKNRASAAAAPNVVHSLDAAHLMTTVNLCVDNHVDGFAMIHDSFGTLACDTETLWTALRKSFVEQYSGDVLKDIYMGIMGKLPEELQVSLETPPKQGDLDLSKVMESDFFFS